MFRFFLMQVVGQWHRSDISRTPFVNWRCFTENISTDLTVFVYRISRTAGKCVQRENKSTQQCSYSRWCVSQSHFLSLFAPVPSGDKQNPSKEVADELQMMYPLERLIPNYSENFTIYFSPISSLIKLTWLGPHLFVLNLVDYLRSLEISGKITGLFLK